MSSEFHVPLMTAADLQNDLISAMNDLDRLQGLISQASDLLLVGFQRAVKQIQDMVSASEHTPLQPAFDVVMQHLGGAITALQFQDMASQLIAHTHQRLRSCTDRIAREAMGDEEGEALVEQAPLRPNPVTQDEMDAGSVELF